LSIFWYGKEKENHSNKIIATSHSNSSLKEKYEREIEDIAIRNDVLLEIATFLAKRWSNIDDVNVIISKEKKISTNHKKPYKRMIQLLYHRLCSN